MVNKRKKAVQYILMALITIMVVFPFVWMLVLSFKTNSEILSSPLSLPKTFNFENYKHAMETLNFPRLYGNTLFVCIISLVAELVITFCSSFVLARMEFKNEKIWKRALIFPYIATSISFNTLLLVGYLKSLPTEIDEAAVIDGCNIWDLMVRVILPMTKPVIATVVIFNVLYIWNEFPFASVMLRDVSDYTLSMGASFFKGTYTVDYGGIVASSVMIIIPELIFYGIFQKNIVEGMTAGAVKG